MNTLTQRLHGRRTSDEGDVVQTVILIAGFVIVAIILVVWLSIAMLNKGADTATCIEAVKAPNITETDAGTEGNCKAVDHSSEHSFTSTADYQERY